MPLVLSRWSASSSWVQLARSSPCLAGPSMTQRRTSSASAAGILPGLPLAFLGCRPSRPRVAVGVEPAGDGLAVDAQVGGDVLAGAAPVGHQDDLEAVPELAVVGRAEQGFEAFGLGRGQLDADHGSVLSTEGVTYR